MNLVSDVKVSIADSESGAKAGLSGYEVVVSYKSGGNYIYIGCKYTTDPSKAITDLVIVDNEGICKNDNYLEGKGKSIYYNKRYYYKAPYSGSCDLNKGGGGSSDYLSLFYSRSLNTQYSNYVVTEFLSGAKDNGSDWDNVYELHSNNDIGSQQSVAKPVNGPYMSFKKHQHKFNHYSSVNDTQHSMNCKCELECYREDHDYKSPTFKWNGTNSCEASFYCTACYHYYKTACTVTDKGVTKAATCTVDGEHTYTASAKNPVTGTSYSSNNVVAVKAVGHHVFEKTDSTRSECTTCHHGFFRYEASEAVTPNNASSLLDADGNQLTIVSNAYDSNEKCYVMEFNKPLVTLGTKAFFGRMNFTGTLVIPNSVKSIGDHAFDSCFGFTGNLVIPNSVLSIGAYAFYSCTGIKGSLTLGNSVQSIGYGAFNYCLFTGDLIIPKSVKSINSYAFSLCSAFNGSLVIPSSVQSIGEFAFYRCDSLASVINYATTPLDYANKMFSYMKITLYVPGPSVAAYKAKEGWKDFKSIRCIEGTHDIEHISIAHTCTMNGLEADSCRHLRCKRH